MSHHYSGRTADGSPGTPGRHRRRSPWSAFAGRAAVVAGSTATALVATLQALPAPAVTPATLAPSTTDPAPVVVNAPIRTLGAARPAALPAGFDATFAVAAAAPTALRAAALQRALGKIGTRYRYGASGPNAFDCSGLVSWAYGGAGRSLPHSSRAMSRIGAPVSRAALQPGDLVFFYRGPSHVAIYVGNGKVVHASTSGQPVKLANLSSMPFNSARRV